MSTIQYTIRGVPVEVDARLRRLAKLRGQSLNKIVVDYLATQSSPAIKLPAYTKKLRLNTDFDDLFGKITPLEPKVEAALRAQRIVNPKDWQ